jgi:aminoglycoside phosphotransferase (APT) family kinase protein
MQRSSRDPAVLQAQLQTWLAGRLGAGAEPAVTDLEGTDANGMSSDTVLFRASWTAGGTDYDERLVARIAPAAADVPVFPSYDLPGQFQVIEAVATHSDVPVPKVWWCEPSADPVGAPFFVMSRVDGQVPPDNLPYSFGDNWLFDATPEQQRRLQDTTVAAIAALHDIGEPAHRFPALCQPGVATDPLRAHVARTREWYDMVAAAGTPSPLVERTFDWLAANWPRHESPTVLSWGDARIGNVLYVDFAPVALLDWEMAGLGPGELDVGWIAYAHFVFQDLARKLELPGMPEFLRYDDVATSYEAIRGHTPRNLRFFMVYAALQWSIVFLRTGQRRVHFGEQEMPPDPEELILNRDHLDSLLPEIPGD